jgi:hypothetical protein
LIGRAIALVQIPNQRVFGPNAVALYSGIHEQTLKKITDEGLLKAKK